MGELRIPMDISSLFNAKSVALIGASEKSRFAMGAFENMQKYGFPPEKFFLVNPSYDSLLGRTCYHNISQIKEKVELAVLATPTKIVLPVIQECIDAGVRGAIIYADGFAESGPEGASIQSELAKLCEKNDFVVCGPNCQGFVFPRAGLVPFAAKLPSGFRSGGIGLVFNSSGLLNLVHHMVTNRAVGISCSVATGNEAVVSTADYLRFLLHDPLTNAIMMFCDSSMKDSKSFADAIEQSYQIGKPIAMLWLGGSERVREAVLGHTGNLVAASDAWEILLRQKGVALVNNVDDLVESAIFFDAAISRGKKVSDRIGLATISGGDTGLVSYYCDKLGLKLPSPSQAVQDTISSFRGEGHSHVGNPLDLGGLMFRRDDVMDKCLGAFFEERNFDLAGCRLLMDKLKPTEELMQPFMRINKIANEHNRFLVFFSRAAELLDPQWFEFFDKLHVPFLHGYDKGLRAIKAYVNFIEIQTSKYSNGEMGAIDHERVEFLKKTIDKQERKVLPYEVTQELLRIYGVPQMESELVHNAERASDAARKIGYPVALKIASADLTHKSDVGGIALSLKDGKQVRDAYEKLAATATKLNLKLEGIIVQRMASDAIEGFVGISNDPQLGPLVVFGLGGVFVEILKDASMRVPPLNITEAKRMVSEIRGSPVLLGARGRSKRDVSAVARTILQLSKLASDFEDRLTEFEINPIMIFQEGKGVAAVDVRGVKSGGN